VTARLTVLDEEETKQREAEDEERRAREAENAPPIVEGEVSVERPDDAKGEQTQEAEDVDHADTAEDEATSADEPAIGAGSGDGEGGAAWTQSWMRMDEPPVQPQPEPVAVPAAAAAAAANDAGAEDSDSDSSESDEHEGRENLDYDGEEGDEYESRDYEGGDDDEGVGGDDDEREGEDYDGDIDYSRSHDEGEDEGGDDWADNGADSDSDRPIPPEITSWPITSRFFNSAISYSKSAIQYPLGVADNIFARLGVQSQLERLGEFGGIVPALERAFPALEKILPSLVGMRLRVWLLKMAGTPLGELAELRAEKQKINTRKRSLDDRIKELKKATTLDLGPNGEFFTLSRKCFKYDAPDYTYEFCPFDHVSQKKGGVEIAALGSWQNSDGWVAVSKYTQMKYSHGMRCWSGPDRSTVVTLKCGARSEVTSVSEPEMCSYALTFVTPAACTDEHLANLEQLLSKLKAYKDEL